jgi:transcriptional regulator with XRE-family HTH domain
MFSGERLSKARREIGESQVTFATRIDVSVSTLQRWEADHATPDANQLRDLAKATAKHMSWFYVETI